MTATAILVPEFAKDRAAEIAWPVGPPMPASRSPISHRPDAFIPKTERQLYDLAPEALLAYVTRAKGAKAKDHARTAIHMLLFRHEERMRTRVRARLPLHLAHHADTVSDWVLERIMRSALKLQLEGESIGEWVNWTETAIARQIISFWRTAQGQALEQQRMLASEHEEDEGVHDSLGVDFDEERVADRIDAIGAIDAVLGSMSNRDHVAILNAVFWEDRSSAYVATEYGTSVANVDQIKTRFRKELRSELEARGLGDT